MLLRRPFIVAFLSAVLILSGLPFFGGVLAFGNHENEETVDLPSPKRSGELSVEEAIARRRSVRGFADEPLSLSEVSGLLWAVQGITDPDSGKRAAPSAGMTYPLEVYLVVGSSGVEGLTEGVYHFIPEEGDIERMLSGNIQPELAGAALGQGWVEEAPVDLVITGLYERTTRKYGGRGIRYVHMEAGAAAQNLYLQAEALGLGMVTVGAFRDGEVRDLLTLSGKHTPLFIVSVGRPSGGGK